MKITFPFGYVANISTARIKDDRRRLIDTFETEVREAAAEDAPVVARWRQTDYLDNKGEVISKYPYVDMHVVRFDGAFYKMAGRSARHPVVLKADMLVPAGVQKFHGNAGPMYIFPDAEYWDAKLQVSLGTWYEGSWGRQPTEADIVSRHRSGRAAKRKQAEELVDGLLAIDGTLYQRVPEPKFAVETLNDGELRAMVSTGQSHFWGQVGYNTIGLRDSSVRLANLRDAKALLKEFGKKRVSPYAIDIEILDDMLFVFDIARNERWRTMGAIVQELSDQLPTLAPEALMAWGRLRDVSGMREEKLADADLEGAMAHVDILKAHSEPKDERQRSLYAYLDELWDAAPISAEFALA